VVYNSHASHRMSSIKERKKQAEEQANLFLKQVKEKEEQFTNDDNLEEQIIKLESMLGKNANDPKKYLIERRDTLLKQWQQQSLLSFPPSEKS
jgi:hypothetical protein